MYIISKSIYFLLNPLVWVCLLLGWAIWAKDAARQRKRLKIGFFTLFFFSFAPIFQVFAWLWEVPLTNIDTMKEKYAVGIVLGGYSDDALQPQDRLHFNSAGTRLITTVELYKKGIIQKIVLTGGTFSLKGEVKTEAELAYAFLQTLGIPDADIILEKASLNTRENALFSKKILEKNYDSSAKYLLITSAWHMRRSKACFDKAGLEAIPFSTDPFEGKILTSKAYYFFPNTTILEAWRILIKEWFGMLMYKLMGYA